MKRGDRVPEFELPDQTGTVRSLTSLLADGPVVLFFYPAAMTPGCTKEACHFRDLASEFADLGANRVGISTDGVDKQAKFSDSQRFDYPLLSDADGKVAETFGVKFRVDVERRIAIEKAREAGKLRAEGKAYVVKDGDVMNFLFNT